jgi:hypothetical protein
VGEVSRTPAIRVRVTGVSALRDVIGRDRIISLNSGSTVGNLLDELEGDFGSAYKEMMGEGLTASLKKRFSMLLNGQKNTQRETTLYADWTCLPSPGEQGLLSLKPWMQRYDMAVASRLTDNS